MRVKRSSPLGFDLNDINDLVITRYGIGSALIGYMNSSRKVTIMSGVSGSGKSTYAKDVFVGAEPTLHGDLGKLILSADDYFYQDGKYTFNPAHLPLAHGACLRHFIRACQDMVPHVVVDNTNTNKRRTCPLFGCAANEWQP